MYSWLHGLLCDKKGGAIFTLFSPWHFFYIVLTAAVIALLLVRLKSGEAREKAAGRCIHLAFGLYILDFFLMPLAYGYVDIEKLPFHACTAMCVMCFLSHHSPFLGKFRQSFALLGFVSNCVYLIYPAGVMWHGVHPMSYRVIQTLLFHSVMTVYGLLTLINSAQKPEAKLLRRDLLVVAAMTAWAMLGNAAYNGSSEGYSHFFNWFFVVRDPFYLLPEAFSPYVMPVLNILLFFTVGTLVRLLLYALRKK